MDAFLWITLPILVAAGSAILSFHLMKARLEVAVSKEREATAEANARLKALEQSVPDKVRAAEESARRKAFDLFLLDFRVEERRFLRESRSHLATRRSVILQERLYFRNIPLSNWVEHEMALDDGAGAEVIDKNSVFSARALSDYSKGRPKLLAQ